MRRATIVVAAVLALAGCAPTTSSSSTPSPAPSFPRGTVLIDTGSDTVLVHVLVAQTEEQREHGLMDRTSLPADDGMVFIFFEPTQSGFWMKDTLIPLSIAFFDVDGKILKILDMKPCAPDASPCPIYDPGVSYMGALEVNRGAFERLGVGEGDTVHVVPGGE